MFDHLRTDSYSGDYHHEAICTCCGRTDGRHQQDCAAEAAADAINEVICTTHHAQFSSDWIDGHKSGPLGEQNAPGACVIVSAHEVTK